jgi:phosphate-selective porin OprO/OprP
MRNIIPSARTGLVAALLLASLPSAHAADDTNAEIQALREQIRLLSQRVDALQQQQATNANQATAPGSATPATLAVPTGKINFDDQNGFRISSADGSSFLHLGGQIQADTRWYFSQNKGITNDDAFLIRRARIILDGQFNNNTTFLVMPDFGGSSPTLFDAYVNQKVTPEFQLRAGRFKSPSGLEELQNDAWTEFVERSFVSQLLPNRDIGLDLNGDLFNGTLNYAVGVFDGSPDGQSNGVIVAGAGVAAPTVNSDSDNNKDVDARLFAQPFKNEAGSPLKGLGFGISATDGRELPASGLTGYKTESQQTAFTYRTTSVIQGETWRVSPQAYYYYGPFGFLGEYALSTIHARPTLTANNEEQIQNKAWQLTAGYVLTGEDASYNGVTPKTEFNWADGTWGAFEVVARYDVLDLDKKLFLPDPTGATSLADPLANPQDVTNYGLGLNWYLSRNVRASLDFFHGVFTLPTGTTTANTTNARLKSPENAVDARVQIQF